MTARPMPALLAEVCSIAGAEAAASISRAKGGLIVRLPARPGPRSWLTLAVGPEAAAKLCAHFRSRHMSGIRILIPLGEAGKYPQARRQALQLREQGMSIRDTARRVGVSTRTIEKWAAAARHAAQLSQRQSEEKHDG